MRLFLVYLALILGAMAWLALMAGPIIAVSYLSGWWSLVVLPFSLAAGAVSMDWAMRVGLPRLMSLLEDKSDPNG